MQTINRTKKVQTLHPATVRSILKKNGIKIGSWGANGRIKGMSNFYGGNVEVKENWITSDFETKKSEYSDNLRINILTNFVSVEVSLWNSNKVGYNTNKIQDIAKILKDNGLTVSKINKDSLIVDNK